MAKSRPFKWKGPGVLWIDLPNKTRVVVHPAGEELPDGSGTYSGVVRKDENLEAIGKDRMDELVAEGMAEYITFLEDVSGKLTGAPDSSNEPRGPADEVIASAPEDAKVAKRNADVAQRAKIKAEEKSVTTEPEVDLNDEKPEGGAGPK